MLDKLNKAKELAEKAKGLKDQIPEGLTDKLPEGLAEKAEGLIDKLP